MIYELTIESQLYFDDSEYRKEILGFFSTSNDLDERVNDLLDEYWDMNGEDILNPSIIKNIKGLIENGEESFTILEDDSTVNFESCRRIFTVSIEPVKVETTNKYHRTFGSELSKQFHGADLEKVKGSMLEKIKEAIESLDEVEEVSFIDIEDNKIKIEVSYNVEQD